MNFYCLKFKFKIRLIECRCKFRFSPIGALPSTAGRPVFGPWPVWYFFSCSINGSFIFHCRKLNKKLADGRTDSWLYELVFSVFPMSLSATRASIGILNEP